MFPDDTVALDDEGFNDYLTSKFLKSAHLFNDITIAASKIRIQGTHMTVDSRHTYHSNFCKCLVPFSEEIALQSTSTDLHETLIKAFYDGIPQSFANKLRETSCSTWTAAQQNFRECNTKANVQLAQAAAVGAVNKSADNRNWDHKKSEEPEGKRALTATSVSTPSQGKTKSPQQVKAEVKSGTEVLDTGQSCTGLYCSSCRGQHPTDACPKLPCFVCHEFDEPSHHKQSDCPYRARVKASKAKAARCHAREVQFLARHDDPTHGKSNFWLATMTPKIRSIRMTFLILDSFLFFTHTLCMFFLVQEGRSTLRHSTTILDSHLYQI